MWGPRHVTEEAAKRDKESLDGKPIDEQLAGVASLDLLSHATQAAIKARRERQRDARSRHARREAESSSARAARLLIKARREKARCKAQSSSARAARLLIKAHRDQARRKAESSSARALLD